MIGKKKGQAAMEYLMTYGWAILVIIIVLALLLYLGVFTPSLPEVCKSKAPGWTCTRFRLTAGAALNFDLSPALRAVTVTRAKCTQETGIVTTGGSAWSGTTAIQPGNSATFSAITCHNSAGTAIASFTTGEEYRGKVNIQYYYNDEGSAATRQEQFDLVVKASS